MEGMVRSDKKTHSHITKLHSAAVASGTKVSGVMPIKAIEDNRECPRITFHLDGDKHQNLIATEFLYKMDGIAADHNKTFQVDLSYANLNAKQAAKILAFLSRQSATYIIPLQGNPLHKDELLLELKTARAVMAKFEFVAVGKSKIFNFGLDVELDETQMLPSLPKTGIASAIASSFAAHESKLAAGSSSDEGLLAYTPPRICFGAGAMGRPVTTKKTSTEASVSPLAL